MSRSRELIQQFRRFGNQKILQAVGELRKKGWLDDGTFDGLDFGHVHEIQPICTDPDCSVRI